MSALAPSHPRQLVAERRLASLARALGPAIAAALAEENVVEVLINADGRLRIDRVGAGIEATNVWLSIAERDPAFGQLRVGPGETTQSLHTAMRVAPADDELRLE